MDYIQSFLVNNPLIELWMVTLVLVLSWYIMKRLKQPVLIWYILGWLLLWPQVFDVIHNYENIEFYAHFWVSLLLFMVWLWLNPSIIKEVWKVASIAWIWQVIFTSIIWFWLSLLLWFSPQIALFIAIALTFSSTIIIVKLISDRWDSSTTYGKIALWILIVQDILAMIILLIISSMSMWVEWWSFMMVVRIVTTVAFLLYLARLASKHILPKVLQALSEEKELLLLFIITRAILLWWLWYYAGFSMERVEQTKRCYIALSKWLIRIQMNIVVLFWTYLIHITKDWAGK